MTRVIKLKRGLDISLAGVAEPTTQQVTNATGVYALQPNDFPGVKPKVVVREGDRVMAGQALFVSKSEPQLTFASPVSGTVQMVERGDRRKVLSVQVKADAVQQYQDIGAADPQTLTAEGVREKIMQGGLFGFIHQLPYAICAGATTTPKAIFVSALRDMPLQGDFEVELRGNEQAWQTGLTALSRIATVQLGIGQHQTAAALRNAKDVQVTEYVGKCPAGNVGVQVNHTAPVNKGEVVWTVAPSAVIYIGRLFLTGKTDMRHVVALAGPMVSHPQYYAVNVGQPISDLTAGRIKSDVKVRLIDGNPLTGRLTSPEAYLSATASEVTAIAEGDDADEMLGWIMPRLGEFSTSRSYFSWLMPKRQYSPDARVKGGERHMIMSGEYDKVLPMDIYGEYLIKAIIAGDIDKMEALGIYEVSPEDFALAEFVDSSKMELQKIVRQGLDLVRKEME